MSLAFQEVERIKKQFEQEYFFAQPYSEYVNMCGIAKIGVRDKIVPIDVAGDFCILVGLRKPLPQNLSLPTEYQGVKVVVGVIGEIRPL
ncbi:MAG: hypothetical protein HYW89_01545 [Candidatus Sungiibacteriota bacterium]|uniref:Uncharacterized protein n=1 Tax=Candidatus Sungiibacteriota bacterium TaxID=2750080 RepID=A0A7T5RK25_9BACT|nr:MAG: hypothetical protein HYW89_01545 [Candidatus Sungbacteria bacterium]